MTISMQNANHYDEVVGSWQEFMGGNFHWGYFARGDETLDQATDALIQLLASRCANCPPSRVLDIGCGIGGPARRLFSLFDCDVVGVSNSEAGIAIAKQHAADLGLSGKLEFLVRDALSTGLDSESFDLVWLMEMSHLISDKQALIGEAARCAKRGGIIALCDLTFRVRKPFAREVVAMQRQHHVLKKAFGQAHLETLDQYVVWFRDADLKDIQVHDISKSVIPTLQYWRSNALQYISRSRSKSDAESATVFIEACDVLEQVYNDGKWGYGCITAVKS